MWSATGAMACRSMPFCLKKLIRARRRLVLAAADARHRAPGAIHGREVLADRRDRAVFRLQPLNHVVHRLEHLAVVVDLPGREGDASCPVRACASAAMVSRFLLPTEVMKSTVTSVLVLSDHCATSLLITSLPAGTQWSHQPTESLPAAPAVRIWTSGSAAAAAAILRAWRRVVRVISPSPRHVRLGDRFTREPERRTRPHTSQSRSVPYCARVSRLGSVLLRNPSLIVGTAGTPFETGLPRLRSSMSGLWSIRFWRTDQKIGYSSGGFGRRLSTQCGPLHSASFVGRGHQVFGSLRLEG